MGDKFFTIFRILKPEQGFGGLTFARFNVVLFYTFVQWSKEGISDRGWLGKPMEAS
jgi:hypothetical protein